MAANPLLATAIQAVSHTVPCLRCNGTIRISYSVTLGCPVNHHPVRHPVDDPEAVAFAETVDSEIRRHVALGDYGEPAPLNVIIPWAAA